SRRGPDIEGDVCAVQPAEPLRPRSSYQVEVTDRLIDKDGVAVAPFQSSFTTGDARPPPTPAEGFPFTKSKVDDVQGPPAIAVGPDGNVYVSTYYGVLDRLRI